MRETKSIIFVPDNIKYISTLNVGSSPHIGYLPISDQIKRNPLQREMIRRQAKKRGEYKGAYSEHSFIPRKIDNEDISRVPTNRDKNYSGKKQIIKNMTEGMVNLHFSTKLQDGKPIEEYIEIKDYLNIDKLTESQKNSPQFQRVLQSGIIQMITKEQMQDEMKYKISQPDKKSSSGARRIERSEDSMDSDDIVERATSGNDSGVERLDIGRGGGGGMSDLIREVESADEGPIRQSDFKFF